MKGGAIPFVDDDSDDAGLMYDDIGGIAPAPLEKAPKPQEPTNGALPDLTPSPQKKKKSGKDVLGVTTKNSIQFLSGTTIRWQGFLKVRKR